MRKTAAIILAAGASTRLGRPKQLVRFGGENLLERSVRVVREAALLPIVAVLGSSAKLILEGSNLAGVRVVVNPCWQEGMASSIRTGIEALPDADGVVIMVCDMPAVTAHHLLALAETALPTATMYAGRRGVPAYLPRSMFSALMNLHGDAGARELLKDAMTIKLPGGELDIDTEEDVTRALETFGYRPACEAFT